MEMIISCSPRLCFLISTDDVKMNSSCGWKLQSDCLLCAQSAFRKPGQDQFRDERKKSEIREWELELLILCKRSLVFG